MPHPQAVILRHLRGTAAPLSAVTDALLVMALAGGALLAWPAPAARAEPLNLAPPRDAQGDPLPAGALARLGTVRFRSIKPIYSFSMSADGKLLVAHDGEGVRLWDLETGKVVRRFVAREGLLGCTVALSPDGKTFAARRWLGGGVARQLVLWDVSTDKEVRRMERPADDYPCMAFSPDGKTLAATDWEKRVHVWDVGTGKEIKAWQAPRGCLPDLAFSADGKRIATASHGGTAYLWDAATGAKIQEFVGHTDVVRGVALSPDGKLLATASADGTARLWDVATGKELRAMKRPGANVISVSFSPDGRRLATSGDGAFLWEMATGKLLKELSRSGHVLGTLFAPDGKRVVSGVGNAICAWDVATGKEVHPIPGHQGHVKGVAFSPDGKLVATAGWDKTVRLWSGAKEVRRLEAGWQVSVVAFAPDGKTLAAGGNDGIALWDAGTGRELRKTNGDEGWTFSLAFAPDGRSLASCSHDDVIHLWDLASGKEVRLIEAQGGATSVAFAPDGKLLASAGRLDYGARIRLWNPAGGEPLATLYESKSVGLAFSPDGTLLAGADEDGKVRLWDVARRAVARAWDGGGVPYAPPAFSRDGRVLVTATRIRGEPTARVWEVATGKERCSFRGHEGTIEGVAVSPDGAVIATASQDTTALLWDLAGRAKAEPLTASEAAGLWAELASEDAALAFRAMRRLTDSPGQSLPLLKEKVVPVRPADPKQVGRLIAALDSDDFEAREKASGELGKMGEKARAQMRDALKERRSAESRRRLEDLLARPEVWPPESLQVGRALEVLERVGTPEAREVLKALAGGVAQAPLTRQARAALERLGR
jgi:WD40 repeat protein